MYYKVRDGVILLKIAICLLFSQPHLVALFKIYQPCIYLFRCFFVAIYIALFDDVLPILLFLAHFLIVTLFTAR